MPVLDEIKMSIYELSNHELTKSISAVNVTI